MGTVWDKSPTWSPDGSRVAFVTQQPGQPNRIRVFDLDTGALNDLKAFSDFSIEEVSWSPKGDTLALTVNEPTHPGYDIALLAADGRGQLTFLTGPGENEQSAAWSPTGDKIAFTRGVTPGNAAGNADLWIMNADGTNQVRLVDAPTTNPIWTASWSPDGTQIVFDQLDDIGTGADLHVIPAAGGTPTRLTDNAVNDFHPWWAARARFILFLGTTGSGSGTVTSSPAGISCSSDCWAEFQDPTHVTLTASPAAGSTFVGWGGDCSGSGSCTVSMHGYRDVTAEFNMPPPPPPPPGGGGGGGFSINPDLGVSITSSNNAPAVNEVVEFSVLVRNKAPVGNALGLHALITLPPDAVLAGPPAYDRGSGCTGTTTLDCNLNFLAAGGSSLIRFSINVGAGGAKTVTARLTMNTPDPNLADNTASLAFEVKAPTTTPPAAGPKVPTGKTFNGTARANTINGTGGPDVIRGLGGNDRLFGLAGNDQLLGDIGNDLLNGGFGNDRLLGGFGNDRIIGGPGRDTIEGSPGNDTIEARDRTRDIINCGPGQDTVFADRIDTVSRNCETIRRK